MRFQAMALAVALVSADISPMLDKFGEQLDFYDFFSFFFFTSQILLVYLEMVTSKYFTQTESSFW